VGSIIVYFRCCDYSSLLQNGLIILWISELNVISYLDHFCRNFINTYSFLSFHVLNSNLNLERTRFSYEYLRCMRFCLPNINNAMYIQQLTEVILPPVQNTLGICNGITSPVFYHVYSRLLILLTFIHASICVSDTFVHPNCFKFINFFFSIFYLLFLKVLLPVSRLLSFRLSQFV